MQPIADLDSSCARALSGVVFDVDDTLTRDGRVEEAAFQALWRLKQQGLHLFAVTGRPLGFAEVMARTWPVTAAVGENGAGFIEVTEHALRYGYYTEDAQRAEHAKLLLEVRARVAEQLPFARLADDNWARRCDVAWDVGERLQLTAEQIARLRALIERCGARCLVSSVHAHALAGSYDKATGAALAIKASLGIELPAQPERWLFVGDSGNDAAAFSFFPVSAGVANVRAYLGALPKPPRYVSTADRGRGFAEIAERILKARAE
ncbi:MAG TPA: HAD-IIB family hydrolase [Polyangiales bacterium]|jgi:HAD superfamily hydrolase (TIGR01484 family)|nr:HAD-IIB family hydrolase [Polyangiales bacterium]